MGEATPSLGRQDSRDSITRTTSVARKSFGCGNVPVIKGFLRGQRHFEVKTSHRSSRRFGYRVFQISRFECTFPRTPSSEVCWSKPPDEFWKGSNTGLPAGLLSREPGVRCLCSSTSLLFPNSMHRINLMRAPAHKQAVAKRTSFKTDRSFGTKGNLKLDASHPLNAHACTQAVAL